MKKNIELIPSPPKHPQNNQLLMDSYDNLDDSQDAAYISNDISHQRSINSDNTTTIDYIDNSNNINNIDPDAINTYDTYDTSLERPLINHSNNISPIHNIHNKYHQQRDNILHMQKNQTKFSNISNRNKIKSSQQQYDNDVIGNYGNNGDEYMVDNIDNGNTIKLSDDEYDIKENYSSCDYFIIWFCFF